MIIATKLEGRGEHHLFVVVVVYHLTVVAIGHGLLKKLWPLVLGCVLRTVGKLFRPAYFVRTTPLLPHPGHE